MRSLHKGGIHIITRPAALYCHCRALTVVVVVVHVVDVDNVTVVDVDVFRATTAGMGQADWTFAAPGILSTHVVTDAVQSSVALQAQALQEVGPSQRSVLPATEAEA